MIIRAIKETLGQVFHSPEATGSWEVECAIDQDVVECDEMDSPPYTGVPAPVVLTDDPWFGSPVISDENQDYMEKETEIKKQEEENRQYWTNESEDIHQEMYDLATKNYSTITQLDPVGGSETFQEGWQSGSGLLQ